MKKYAHTQGLYSCTHTFPLKKNSSLHKDTSMLGGDYHIRNIYSAFTLNNT